MTDPDLRRALGEIDAKNRDEPDARARDWRYESDSEIELAGDDFARAALDDEL